MFLIYPYIRPKRNMFVSGKPTDPLFLLPIVTFLRTRQKRGINLEKINK